MPNLEFPQMVSPDDFPSKFSTRFITTNEQARIAVQAMLQDDIVLFDTETQGLNPHKDKVLLVQLGSPRLGSFVFDARKVDVGKIVKPILENDKILKIGVNLLFDSKMVKQQYGIDLAAPIFDCQLAELTLTSGLYEGGEARKCASFKRLCEKYLHVDVDKEVRNEFIGMPWGTDISKKPHLINYAAMDVYYPAYVYRMQRSLLVEHGLVKALKLDMDLIPVIRDMELKGVKINASMWRNILAYIEGEKYALESKMHKMINKKIKAAVLWEDAQVVNISSAIQMRDVLNKHFGYELESTAYDNLLEVSTGDKNSLVDMLLEYRGYDKLLTSYGKELLEKIDSGTKRLHPAFFTLGAAQTGRFSSSSPNAQNLPTQVFDIDGNKVSMRDCFIPEKGYKYVIADYSAQEVRIAAHRFKEPLLEAAYREGKDAYKVVGSMMFGVPYNDINKHSKERKRAKVIVLGSNYGGGAGAIKKQCRQAGVFVTFPEAQDLLNKYRDTVSDMTANMNKFAKECLAKGYIDYGYGKKRFINHLISDLHKLDRNSKEYGEAEAQIKRLAKNTPVQGDAAIMTKIALLGIWKVILSNKWDACPVLVIHDEICVEAEDSIADQVKVALEVEMEKAFQEICPGFPNKVDANIFDRWQKE